MEPTIGIALAACPLCAGAVDHTVRAHDRTWRDCETCRLISVGRDHLPSEAEERARYETHENDPADAGYRDFLDRLAVPLVDRLTPGMQGLDVGSGPGPTLSVMLAERGFATAVWDPFFAPDPAPLKKTWDFVTCTETVEHFHEPAQDWARLFALVRPGGWLAVMTEPLGDEPFDTWWYARDPTHVSLYRPETLDWIAGRWNADLEWPSRTVAFFRASESVSDRAPRDAATGRPSRDRP